MPNLSLWHRVERAPVVCCMKGRRGRWPEGTVSYCFGNVLLFWPWATILNWTDSLNVQVNGTCLKDSAAHNISLKGSVLLVPCQGDVFILSLLLTLEWCKIKRCRSRSRSWHWCWWSNRWYYMEQGTDCPLQIPCFVRGEMVSQAKIRGRERDFTYQRYERFEKHRLGKNCVLAWE